MFGRSCYALLIVTLCCSAEVCRAASATHTGLLPTFSEPSAAVVSKLSTPVSREAAFNALMANRKTKSALVNAAGKLGIREADIQKSLSAPLQVQFPRPTVGTMTPANTGTQTPIDPNEQAYRELNWHNGFDFTMQNVPTYGPRQYRLGYLVASPCSVWSPPPSFAFISLDTTKHYPQAAMLNVELPMEPALYMITIRLVRNDGKCFQGWLTPRSGRTVPPLACHFLEYRDPPVGVTQIALTTLPDQKGYVGFISANPNRPILVGTHGMRKTTGNIRIALSPGETKPGEEMHQLVFYGFSITRL